jgi:hypothetical protein
MRAAALVCELPRPGMRQIPARAPALLPRRGRRRVPGSAGESLRVRLPITNIATRAQLWLHMAHHVMTGKWHYGAGGRNIREAAT